MTPPAICSALSLELGEPLSATAPQAAAWLLVEQPGPWGAKALTESRLDPGIGGELERRCKQLGIKVLVVKRAGSDGRRCFVAGSVSGVTFLDELPLGDARDLLELDLDGLARGERLGGAPVAGPLYLTCTNAKRDACCATLGRPVAQRLAATRPEQAWESAHVGGHRFAANVVCLPEAVWYGRVRVDDVDTIVAEHEAGRLVLDRLRGRGHLPPEAQAAEQHIREQLGLTGIDDVEAAPVGSADGATRIAVRTPGGLWHVAVRRDEADPRPVSCGEEKLERPAVWRVLTMQRA